MEGYRAEGERGRAGCGTVIVLEYLFRAKLCLRSGAAISPDLVSRTSAAGQKGIRKGQPPQVPESGLADCNARPDPDPGSAAAIDRVEPPLLDGDGAGGEAGGRERCRVNRQYQAVRSRDHAERNARERRRSIPQVERGGAAERRAPVGPD